MFYYILDPGKLPLPKFEQVQVELQGLLHEFHVSGEIARVTTLRTISDLVDVAASRGATTLVACGSDDTLNQVLAAVGSRDFLLAFIPLEPERSFLAGILGLPDALTAVKTIAARRIVTMDLASIGPLVFISFLEFGITSQGLEHMGVWRATRTLTHASTNWVFRIDDSYTMTVAGIGGLLVNSRSSTSTHERIANPTDGFLDLLVVEQLNKIDAVRFRDIIAHGQLEELPNPTVIKCRSVEFLEPRGTPITMFGRQVGKFPTKVAMTGRKLRMIVGKQRTF